MNKIKLGILGCGKQAEKHASSLKSFPNVEIAFADVDCSASEALAQKNGAKWFQKTDDMFHEKDIQGVLICTPTPSHYPLIKKALESGKDVFCEKPLCLNLDEALLIRQLEEKTSHWVMVGYIYRYVPIFEEAYRLLSEYRTNGGSLILGKPLSAFFRLGGRGSHQLWKHVRAEGGGAINEMLVHMIDLANWYFGPLSKPTVISNDLKCATRSINRRMHTADAEDYVMVHCFGAGGVEIVCQADLITPAFSQYLEIQCDNSSFMGSIQHEMPSFIYMNEGRGGYDSGKTVLQFGKRNVLDIQMASFVRALSQDKPPDRNRVDDSIQLFKIIEYIRSRKDH